MAKMNSKVREITSLSTGTPLDEPVCFYFDSTNEPLDDAVVDFSLRYDGFLQEAIESGNWEPRPGQAYEKSKDLAKVRIKDLGVDIDPFVLQMAKVFVDPKIKIPGVPPHNHRDYSEYFWVPKGRGEGVLGVSKELQIETPDQEIVLEPGAYSFIPGPVYHSVKPKDPDSVVYIAVLRFDHSLLSTFPNGYSLELVDV